MAAQVIQLGAYRANREKQQTREEIERSVQLVIAEQPWDDLNRAKQCAENILTAVLGEDMALNPDGLNAYLDFAHPRDREQLKKRLIGTP